MTAGGTSAVSLDSNTILRGLHTVRQVLAPDLNADELKLFAMVSARSGLDPFAKQIYAVKRKGRVTFQTGIDGYRSIAARTGLYDGQDEPEYGPWIEEPYGHPEYATVRVYRRGVARPIAATAYWDEYVPDPGQSGNGDQMWRRMPRVMLAKVAEALALRKAFPYDPDRREGIGADLYTTEEMAQADRSEPATERPASFRERVLSRRPAPEPEADNPETPGAVEGEVVEADMPPALRLGEAQFRSLARSNHVPTERITEAREGLGLPPSDQMTPEQFGVLADALGLV